jgi:transitional endoplasmic reticulum ATPase
MGKSKLTVELAPCQAKALQSVQYGLRHGCLVTLKGRTGRGRTTVLRELNRLQGGALVTVRDFVTAMKVRHPQSFEEALYESVLEPLQQNDLVIVDDFHLATAVSSNCHFYPRTGYLDAPLTVLANFAIESGKRLVIASSTALPRPISQRAWSVSIDPFGIDDYRHLIESMLGRGVRAKANINYEKVFRFAPKLNGHQLRSACLWLRQHEDRSTERLIEYLRSRELSSNVNQGEVSEVELKDLKGVDEVVRSLEAHVVTPLENDTLAEELGLQSKRGVLLLGPPGTGKTTVGRALARRLKGKFFLIDGTFISGTRDFYGMVSRVFKEAEENAPAIIFIDDSDVIFESGQEHGLYRYLLTMLDGLESKSAGRVCVIMTAMDVANLPPALLRSGRIELWLEMRLPDENARRQIIEALVADVAQPLRDCDIGSLVDSTPGFTGADLRRTVSDAVALYGFDVANDEPTRAATDYYLDAVQTVQASKQRYVEAERRTRVASPNRPPWFNVPMGADDDDDDE